MTPHISLVMYYVYILRSSKDGSIYIGYTENLGRRLKEHVAGKRETIAHA